MGQVPLTYMRQVIALATYPKLLDDPCFPDDAKAQAREILGACKGWSVGSYTDSTGIELIRRHVAEYIKNRDGIDSDWNNVVLCGGKCYKMIINSNM